MLERGVDVAVPLGQLAAELKLDGLLVKWLLDELKRDSGPSRRKQPTT
jgi:hypothetical protein